MKRILKLSRCRWIAIFSESWTENWIHVKVFLFVNLLYTTRLNLYWNLITNIWYDNLFSLLKRYNVNFTWNSSNFLKIFDFSKKHQTYDFPPHKILFCIPERSTFSGWQQLLELKYCRYRKWKHYLLDEKFYNIVLVEFMEQLSPKTSWTVSTFYI